MNLRIAVLGLAFPALLLSTSALADVPSAHDGIATQASSASPTEVLVMHATQTATPSVDPKIGNLPQLTRPPFSKKYNTYKLLDRKTPAIERSKPWVYTLPTGRLLQVAVEPAGALSRVTASISKDKTGNEYVKVLEVTAPKGEPFFVAGQSFDGGALVIALTLR